MSDHNNTDEFQTPKTLADLAATPAPWVGVPTIYKIVSDNFEAVHAAKQNGWPWRSIIKPLGLQPSDTSKAAAAYAGILRHRARRAERERQAQAAEAAQKGQGGGAGEDVPDTDEWC
jgi:hypothetical protein